MKQEKKTNYLAFLKVYFSIFLLPAKGERQDNFKEKVDTYTNIFVWKAEESHQT